MKVSSSVSASVRIVATAVVCTVIEVALVRSTTGAGTSHVRRPVSGAAPVESAKAPTDRMVRAAHTASGR